MKIKVLLALTAMFFLFCACPQVDPDPDPVDPDPVETEELVMVKGFRFGDDDDWGGYGFDYDSKGRLNRIYTHSSGESDNQILAHIYYEDNIVNFMSEELGHRVLELDAKGRVTKVTPTFHGYDYGTFEYDASGYIKTVNHVDTDNPDENIQVELKITDGNYTYMSYNHTFVEYTKYPNNYSIDMNWYLWMYERMMPPFSDFWFMRFNGGYSRNLIKRIQCEDADISFAYEFNDSGNVSAIVVNNSERMNIVY